MEKSAAKCVAPAAEAERAAGDAEAPEFRNLILNIRRTRT